MNKQDYINAVNTFNNIGSFQISFPFSFPTHQDTEVRERVYNELASRFTNIVNFASQKLAVHEMYRRQHRKYEDMADVNNICLLVVHLNQIANGVKEVYEPVCTFDEALPESE